jgi:hypothetical protein
MVTHLGDSADRSGGARQGGNFVSLGARSLFARAALTATLAASSAAAFTTLATRRAVLPLLGGGTFSAGLYRGNGAVRAGSAFRFSALALSAFTTLATAFAVLARSAVASAFAALAPALFTIALAAALGGARQLAFGAFQR